MDEENALKRAFYGKKHAEEIAVIVKSAVAACLRLQPTRPCALACAALRSVRQGEDLDFFTVDYERDIAPRKSFRRLLLLSSTYGQARHVSLVHQYYLDLLSFDTHYTPTVIHCGGATTAALDAYHGAGVPIAVHLLDKFDVLDPDVSTPKHAVRVCANITAKNVHSCYYASQSGIVITGIVDAMWKSLASEDHLVKKGVTEWTNTSVTRIFADPFVDPKDANVSAERLKTWDFSGDCPLTVIVFVHAPNAERFQFLRNGLLSYYLSPSAVPKPTRIAWQVVWVEETVAPYGDHLTEVFIPLPSVAVTTAPEERPPKPLEKSSLVVKKPGKSGPVPKRSVGNAAAQDSKPVEPKVESEPLLVVKPVFYVHRLGIPHVFARSHYLAVADAIEEAVLRAPALAQEAFMLDDSSDVRGTVEVVHMLFLHILRALLPSFDLELMARMRHPSSGAVFPRFAFREFEAYLLKEPPAEFLTRISYDTFLRFDADRDGLLVHREDIVGCLQAACFFFFYNRLMTSLREGLELQATASSSALFSSPTVREEGLSTVPSFSLRPAEGSAPDPRFASVENLHLPELSIVQAALVDQVLEERLFVRRNLPQDSPSPYLLFRPIMSIPKPFLRDLTSLHTHNSHRTYIQARIAYESLSALLQPTLSENERLIVLYFDSGLPELPLRDFLSAADLEVCMRPQYACSKLFSYSEVVGLLEKIMSRQYGREMLFLRAPQSAEASFPICLPYGFCFDVDLRGSFLFDHTTATTSFREMRVQDVKQYVPRCATNARIDTDDSIKYRIVCNEKVLSAVRPVMVKPSEVVCSLTWEELVADNYATIVFANDADTCIEGLHLEDIEHIVRAKR